jgi:DNA polymerase-3 subunit epsilon
VLSAEYYVLDVETANADYASICQIGLIRVQTGRVVSEELIWVNPDDYFDPFNIGIHGITPDAVRSAPKFADLAPTIGAQLAGSIVLHHGPFDRLAMNRACDRCAGSLIDAKWLDNQRIVRRVWPAFSRSGYALANLAAHFGIIFTHHNALEDARATNAVFQHAVAELELPVEELLDYAYQRISGTKLVRGDGSVGGTFFGETIVFTGALCLPRRDAAVLAQAIGFAVADTVNRKTTVLCVGVQDRDKLKGYEKSSKHRHAEALIGKNHQLTIISEDDFLTLVEQCGLLQK